MIIEERLKEIAEQDMLNVRLSLEEYAEYCQLGRSAWGGRKEVNPETLKLFQLGREIIRKLSNKVTSFDLVVDGFARPLIAVKNDDNIVEIAALGWYEGSALKINDYELENLDYKPDAH